MNLTSAGQSRIRATPPGSALPRRLIVLVLVIQCLLPLWFSAGDHALYAPDEGRYASVSTNMLESGNWLVPMRHGRPHLTKPPLVYWLQAMSVKIIGKDELALRLPSLFAATLTVLITFGIGLCWGGPRRGLLAAGLLSLSPLHLIVGRLAITDSVLTMCWTATLFAGVMTGRSDPRHPGRSWGWAALMWAAVAMGLMTKGPLALAPVGLLVLWMLLSGQRALIGRLHLPPGLLLALVPVTVWACFIIQHDPQALIVWKHEMLDRASGNGGDHPEPLWYYIPIVIGGLFPATATLRLPGIDYSWREAWRYCRTPQIGSLLVLAVVVPFIGFTLMSGKLATYVLPLGPPLALLGARVLETRMLSEAGASGSGKALQSIAAIAIATALVVAVMAAGDVFFGAGSLWTVVIAAATPLAAAGVWIRWTSIRRCSRNRVAAAAILWIAGLISWSGIFEFEDALTRRVGTPALIEKVHAVPGLGAPIIATIGYEDETLFWYVDEPAIALRPAEIASWLAGRSPVDRLRMVLLAREDIWREFSGRHPETASLFEDVGCGVYRFKVKVRFLRPRPE